ncbi:ATP-binding cassette domain-containing protein [Kaarinaea lacus]
MRSGLQSAHAGSVHDPVIRATELVRSFGRFTAVDHVNISVQRGEVFGLLGANGAGKTTTIRMLCGTLAPTSGHISISGVDMVRNARHARSRIGYVSQRFALYGDLQVIENLNLQAGLYNVNGKRKKQRIQWALEHLSLMPHKSVLAKELPLGYKRRLAFAAALLHEPEVLFLDEPTSGVDPAARQHFWELIYDLADAGIGILVTTHYMDEALFCDRIALMHAGRVIAEDTPQNLQQTPLKTTLLELNAPDCKRCVQLLKKIPQVQEVIPHGGELRIRLQAGSNVEKVIQGINDLARLHQVAINKLQVTTAELEDVFIALLEDVSKEKPS